MDFQELHTIEGLKFMPVKENKQPIVKAWQTSTAKHDLSKCDAVGLVCGKLSGGLEVIDLDCKYDLTGKLFENYKRLIHVIDENLLQKLVVQKTKGGGYHFLYRCSVIVGNLKLANRHTTDDEKKQTFAETYKIELSKSKPDEDARKVAQKASDNDKVRVLIETRGEGGFIMCFPSKGYELIYGDFYGIKEISPEERETLHGIARQINEVFEEVRYTPSVKEKRSGLSSFDDYNERGDVVALLESYGWRIVGQKGAKTVFLRPGQTTSASSGNYDHDKKWFSVFTTSTEFNPCHAYLPYAVFAMLECNNDFSLASKKLFDLGYGEKLETKKEERPSTRVIQSRVDPNDNDFSFLAEPNDYNGYLEQVIDGTLPMGKTTGVPSLDEHFLFKEGSMVSVNGIDNTGKTKWIWWLELIAALYHDWHGIIFASENTIGSCMRSMIQFYWGKPLRGNWAMTRQEYEIAKTFVEKHFKLIKAQEDLFNYKDILNMVRKARVKYPELKYGMIDPYNSLKVDLSGFSKLNTHEYHYEALSELKAYGQQTGFGWFVNHHAYTAAARQKDGDKKYPIAPKKEDTEHGVKVANKTDEFITIHRLTQHPTDWNITEVHVRKVKDTETGGRPTSMDSPIRFEMYKGGCAFKEKNETMASSVDPVEEWHKKKGTYKQETLQPVFGKMWQPFKDEKSEKDIDF